MCKTCLAVQYSEVISIASYMVFNETKCSHACHFTWQHSRALIACSVSCARHQESLPHKNKSQSQSYSKNAIFCTVFLFQADARSRRDVFAWRKCIPSLHSYSEFCIAAFRLLILAVTSRSNAQKLRRKF